MHRGPGVHHGQKRAERVWLGWSSRHAFRVVELDGGLEPCSALISPLHPCDLPRGIHDRKHSAGSEGGASASVGPSCDSGQVRSEGLPSVVVHSSIAIPAPSHIWYQNESSPIKPVAAQSVPAYCSRYMLPGDTPVASA